MLHIRLGTARAVLNISDQDFAANDLALRMVHCKLLQLVLHHDFGRAQLLGRALLLLQTN